MKADINSQLILKWGTFLVIRSTRTLPMIEVRARQLFANRCKVQRSCVGSSIYVNWDHGASGSGCGSDAWPTYIKNRFTTNSFYTMKCPMIIFSWSMMIATFRAAYANVNRGNKGVWISLEIYSTLKDLSPTVTERLDYSVYFIR